MIIVRERGRGGGGGGGRRGREKRGWEEKILWGRGCGTPIHGGRDHIY